MKKTRREFIKIAGLSMAGLAGALSGSSLPALAAGKAEYSQMPKELKAKRWGMAIFTKAFKTEEDLRKVIEACHLPHNVPNIKSSQDVKWIWHDSFLHAFPENETKRLSEANEKSQYLLLCNHCDNPPCVRVCPTQATFRRDDGIVVMDYHRCIGCRFCMAGCPYGARSFNFYDPRKDPAYLPYINTEFPCRTKGVVEKCTFCSERLARGQMPYCVEAAHGAILFGDLDDKNSEVARAIRDNYTLVRKPEVGTRPSVYYII